MSPVGCSLKTSAVSSAVSGVLSPPGVVEDPPLMVIPPLVVEADAAGVALAKPLLVLSVDNAVLSNLDIVSREAKGESAAE